MLKLSGIICIILCGAGIGNKASGRLKKQTELCISVRTFLSELGILMRYSGDTLFVLISELAGRESIKGLAFLKCVLDSMSDGTAFPLAWRNAVLADKALFPELSELLLSFGESLGTSGIDGQLMSIERAERELSGIYENVLSLYRRKGRLYRSVGLLGGITAALLLC